MWLSSSHTDHNSFFSRSTMNSIAFSHSAI